MALSTLSLPSVGTFLRFLAGDQDARERVRTFLFYLLEGAQAVEAQVGTGALSSLTTTDQTGLVPALNEVDANADAAQGDATQALADAAAAQGDATQALADAAAAITRYENGVTTFPDLADGTTDGKIKTTATADFRVKGAIYSKAATDDLWDLTAEVDTAADKYRAYWLYLDTLGAASFAAGADSDSEALALAALPAVTATKAVIGVYVAGLSCDFNGVAGLAAQGTLINGWPVTVQ